MKQVRLGLAAGVVGVLVAGALAVQLSRPPSSGARSSGSHRALDRIIALDLKDISVFISQVVVNGDRVEVKAEYLGILDQAPKTAAEWKALAEKAAQRVASGAGQSVTVDLTLGLRGQTKAQVTFTPS